MAGGLIRLAQGSEPVSSTNPLYITGGTTETHRQQVLNANDVLKVFTWLDHGTADVRPSTIVYSSATVGGASHTCTFAWTLASGKYRLDTITWS